MRRIIAPVYFLSGLTALVYETVWIRLFTVSFGNTAQALSTVLSMFLGGLAIGSFAAGRTIIGRDRLGLKIYGVLEAAIGLYALATPALIRVSSPVLANFYPQSPSILAFMRGVLCAVILLPATMLMGATLPVLAGWLASRGTVIIAGSMR